MVFLATLRYLRRYLIVKFSSPVLTVDGSSDCFSRRGCLDAPARSPGSLSSGISRPSLREFLFARRRLFVGLLLAVKLKKKKNKRHGTFIIT